MAICLQCWDESSLSIGTMMGIVEVEVERCYNGAEKWTDKRMRNLAEKLMAQYMDCTPYRSRLESYCRLTFTLLVCVKLNNSSKLSSRPKPDSFTPPNGTPRKCLPT